MRKNRKGFTITELVIVIVVIAILAAVLIPTFASLINKANLSADVQMAKTLNVALSAYEAENGAPETFGETLDALRVSGYLLANMRPSVENCYLAWEKETNQILLVEIIEDEPKYKVLFSAKDEFGEPDDSWYFVVCSPEEADVVKAALPNVNTEMAAISTTALNNEIANVVGEKTLYLDSSIIVDDDNTIKVDKADAKVTLDLGDSQILGGSSNASLRAFPFYVADGELTIKNGVVSAVSSFYDSDNQIRTAALFAAKGVANIDGTKFAIKDTASSIVTYTENTSGTIKNANFETPNGNNVVNASAAKVRIENTNIDCQYIAAQATYNAEVTIAGGNYHASVSNLLCANVNGTIIVEGGNFKCDVPSKTFKFYNYSDNKIVLKGGTFNGVAFESLTEAQLRSWCNLSECPKGVDIYKSGSAWVIDVK